MYVCMYIYIYTCALYKTLAQLSSAAVTVKEFDNLVSGDGRPADP